MAYQFIKDGGVVVGAVYDSELKVKHILCQNHRDLSTLSGSKYVQSDLGDIFYVIKKNLECGIKVLFSGTPCQVAGLKAFLRKDYPNLICVDFLCHSIASPFAFELYKSYIEDKYGKIKKIQFKNKKYGYSFPTLAIEVLTSTGSNTHYFTSQSDPYMYAFLNGKIARPSCQSCRYRQSHHSDLTLADYYHIRNVPFTSPDKGMTRVAIWSEKADSLYKETTGLVNIEQSVNDFWERNDLINHSGPTIDFDDVLPRESSRFFIDNFKVPVKSKIISIARLFFANVGLQKYIKSLLRK